jgi:DNA-binding transcriptional LysR family regulator
MACDVRQMRYFVAVAQTLNFRRAAERLNVAQPAISRALRQLEDELGTPLMLRSNRRVELTEAGKVFLEGCRRSLASIDKTLEDTRRAREGEIGHLSIGYTDFAISGALPAIMQRFRGAHPDITVDLAHMVTITQLQALARGEIQVGFMTGPLAEPGLDRLTVQDERLVVVMAETNPLAELPAVPLARLAGEPFVIGQPAHWRHYLAHMTAVCQSAGFAPRIVQEAYNSEGIFGMIASNMGVTLYVECARNYFRKGLAIRPVADSDHRVPTLAAWNPGALTPALGRFVESLRAWRGEEAGATSQT